MLTIPPSVYLDSHHGVLSVFYITLSPGKPLICTVILYLAWQAGYLPLCSCLVGTFCFSGVSMCHYACVHTRRMLSVTVCVFVCVCVRVCACLCVYVDMLGCISSLGLGLISEWQGHRCYLELRQSNTHTQTRTLVNTLIISILSLRRPTLIHTQLVGLHSTLVAGVSSNKIPSKACSKRKNSCHIYHFRRVFYISLWCTDAVFKGPVGPTVSIHIAEKNGFSSYCFHFLTANKH